MDKATSLLRDLRSDDPIARARAAQSAKLVTLLRGAKNSVYRSNVIESLGLVGMDALETLLKLCIDPEFDRYVQDFARAFGRLGQPAHDPLFKIFQRSDRKGQHRIAIALAHTGDRSVTNIILDALQNSSEWWIRSTAAEAFLIIPDPKAMEHLIEALKDQNMDVRKSAAKALGRLGDPRAIPALEAAYKLRENRGNAYSEEYTVAYFAEGAIRIINQWSAKKI